MINISANIAGHALMLWSPVALPTGSIAVDQLELAQVVGEEWAVCATVTAQFWIKPAEIYEAEFENNVAVIPQEVLSGVGLLHIAVYGSDAAGTKRISTNTVTMPITQGSFTEASAPAPSASLFEQAVSAAVEEVKDEILAPNAVDNEILNDMPPMTVKGNNTNQTGDPKDIPADDFRTMFAMVGASAQRNGRSGFVPTPPTGGNTKFLCADGTWKVPSGGGGASSTDDVTINLPDTVVLIGPVADGDSLSAAMAQINNLVNAVADLRDDKLDANGDGSYVTAQRTASIVFGDIPVTPITLRELLNRLGSWPPVIRDKLDSEGGNANAVTVQRNATYPCTDIPVYDPNNAEATTLTLQELLGRLGGWFPAIVGDIQTISGDGSVFVEMSAYTTYWITGATDITLSFDTFDPALRLGDADHLYTIKYVTGSTAPTVTLPSNVATAAGYSDAVSKPNTVVEITIARIPAVEINGVDYDYLATAIYAEASV